jgi:hypothetical protein
MLAAASCALAMTMPLRASAEDADLSCKIHYHLTGWSLVYKHATGDGVVDCANGLSMPVHLTAKAVGVTAGKWRIDDGDGDFTHVFRISDVLGKYAQASADAGVVKAGEAQVVTKGEVSLALAGKGHGMDLGVDVGEFRISR